MDQKANRAIPNGGYSGLEGVRALQYQRKEEEVDLLEIFSLLLHHIWVIALAAVVGALLVALCVKLFVPPKYTAKSTIYVFSLDTHPTTQSLTVTDRLTTDFQIIATTSTTIQKVIDKMDLDMTVKELKRNNSINVTNPEGSHMLRISVTNRNPQSAMEISNTLAEVMCDQIAEIMKSERPQFVEQAGLGTKSSPHVTRDTLAGGVAFGLIAALLVLGRYYMNDTITTEEDVNRYLGLTILSSVPLERNTAKQ